MRYPILPPGKAPAACAALLDDPAADIESYLDWNGDGLELNTTPIEDVAAELRVEHEAFLAGPKAKDRDLFEGRVARRLHETIDSMDIEPMVMDEPGFWGYLTVSYFWWFVSWREPSFGSGDFAKYGKYADGTNGTECVVLRSYLRGQLVHRPGDRDPYELANGIEYGTDFWRSHVLRVQTGMSPVMTQAFAAAQIADRMPTDPLRSYARRLNRMWTNVVLHVYDDAEAEEVVDELR